MRARSILFLCVFLTNCAQGTAERPFKLKQVGPNAWAAVDNPKAAAPAGANAGFVIGETGVTVIDTFWSVDAAKRLLSEIQRRTPLPVRFVINTHYHLDHLEGTRSSQDPELSSLATATCATGFTPRISDYLALLSPPN